MNIAILSCKNHAYPVDTYSSKREPTITCGGDIVQTTPRPYTPALMTS
jgi:hypothetical protein